MVAFRNPPQRVAASLNYSKTIFANLLAWICPARGNLSLLALILDLTVLLFLQAVLLIAMVPIRGIPSKGS